MNFAMIFRILGWMLMFEAAFMAPSGVVAAIYQEGDVVWLIASMGICLSAGSREHLEMLKQDEAAARIIEEGRVIPVFDRYEGCGPMAGILAGFEACGADYLYVSAIDIVRINKSLIMKADDPETDAYIYQYEDFVEPLFGLYSRRLVPVMEKLLDDGVYKIRQLLKAGNTKYIPLREDQRELFLNCNTPEELEKLKRDV